MLSDLFELAADDRGGRSLRDAADTDEHEHQRKPLYQFGLVEGFARE